MRMRKIITRHKWLTAVSTVVVALALAGGAFAYFTGSGGGSGTATVGTSGTVVLTATVPAGITPGTSEPVSFTAANASSSGVFVSSLSLVSVTVDSGHSACVTGDFSMANVTENHEVPANATAEALPTNGSLVYADTAISQNACKGATLTLTLSSI
jgi:hypothetical protein